MTIARPFKCGNSHDETSRQYCNKSRFVSPRLGQKIFRRFVRCTVPPSTLISASSVLLGISTPLDFDNRGSFFMFARFQFALEQSITRPSRQLHTVLSVERPPSLAILRVWARYPSGKGEVCKTFIRGFDSHPRLQRFPN